MHSDEPRHRVDVTVYGRRRCHLCDIAKDVIEETARARDLVIELRIIDIDEHPPLQQLFTNDVPVVFVDGERAFTYKVDAGEFAERVRRAAEKERA